MTPLQTATRSLCLRSCFARLALAPVVLCFLSGNAFSQKAPADPNDAKQAVVTQPATVASKYLSTHPGASALVHGQGRLNFRNPDQSRTTILGPVTRRDPQTAAWVPLAPVLSSTKNGWRIDGTWNDVIIRKQGADRHAIAQTYTNPDSKHESVLTLTTPALSYDRGMNFHFAYDGLRWDLYFGQRGAFDLLATVAAKRGLRTYTFDVSSSENLRVDPAGNLVGDANVNLTRAVIIPKKGPRILCSPWTYPTSGGASFACDDSSLTAAQLPYRIDPSSHGFNNNGTYFIDSDTPANVNFNTTGHPAAGATVTGTSCGFDTLDIQGDGNLACNPPIPFSSSGTNSVSVYCENWSEGCTGLVNHVSMSYTSWDPPVASSPANGATGVQPDAGD